MAADISKLMKKRLGPPPPIEEASNNLAAPEVAPVDSAPVSPARREDGRTLRRTGRTIQFSTRVSQKFDDEFRAIAKAEHILLAELLERALDAYKQRK
jgi:hypothetical protein